MESLPRIASVSGRAIPLRGNDIDTDRIIPARYLRCVTFDGLGQYAFEDDRKGLRAKGLIHAFDDPRFAGSSILFVNQNFGCGSSREHAPQSLMRWGIKALVGESFAEIFLGNCIALGLPCATVGGDILRRLQDVAESDPGENWTLDIETLEIRGGFEAVLSMPEGPRAQFLSGRWNPMGELLEHLPAVDSLADTLPYVSGRWS